MPSPYVARIWTREEVLALPDDGYRYELIDGQLFVSPNERANVPRAVMALIRGLDPYVEQQGIGELLTGGIDLDLFEGQRLQPDLCVIPYRSGRRFSDWPDAGIPILVVELRSTVLPYRDRIAKRRGYLRAGVPTYWEVDLDEPRVEVWTSESSPPVVEKKRLVWRPRPSLPAWEYDLDAFYARLFEAT